MSSTGRVFDRAVELRWLDKAFELATRGEDSAQSDMEFWLRDYVESATGRKKTLTVLSRIWLQPTLSDPRVTEWALEHGRAEQDMRPLHIGAIFAAYPFFRTACEAIGRELTLEPDIKTASLCTKMRQVWGDREVIDVGTRSVVRTLKALGVLTGVGSRTSSRQGELVNVTPEVMPWLAHAWLISSGTEEVGIRDLEAVAEIFMFSTPASWDRNYPFAEVFNEGSGRRVFRLRPRGDKARVVQSQRQLLL